MASPGMPILPVVAEIPDLIEAPVAVPRPAPRRSLTIRSMLGWLGRLALGGVLVAGSVLGAQSGIGLLWFLPFAAVGSLLVIRRPRTSIGWLLLGLGWAFAFSSVTVDASAAQFVNRTLPWPTLLLSVLAFAAPGVIFYLLALLALVFPTGGLPGGRWARPVRLALMVALGLLVLTMISPELLLTLAGSASTVAVPNPIAVAPELAAWRLFSPESALIPELILLIASVASLVVRFRRAVGIERQQLRWFGAALVFVVLAVSLGFLIAALIPGSGDAGYAWYPAMVAFPTVALAIGVAVLRYRLYEIDTIINRAIVYGLLTAILAGSSAAAIGVTQRLFEGVVGPGSDATIVMTTLVVVTAFTPVKSRLQAIVDRRFKEIHDPAIELPAFAEEARRFLGPIHLDRVMRRLLEVAVVAYGAHGGTARITSPVGSRSIATGISVQDPGVTAVAAAGDLEVEVWLWGADPSRDDAPLHDTLAAVLGEAIAGDVADAEGGAHPPE